MTHQYYADSLGLPRFDKIEKDSDMRRWPTAPRQIMIDNRDYSAPFQFTVNFDEIKGRYQDCVAAELKAISFPKVDGEAYVVMKIDEVPGSLDCISTFTDEAFAVVYFDNEDMPAGETKAYKGADFYSKRHTINPAKTVDKLHITFYKYGGGIVTPTDTAGRTQISFILELTCS